MELDFWTLTKIIGIIMLLVSLSKIAGKVGSAGASITRWLLYAILGILVIWALYNQVGEKFGLWEPITLDGFISKIVSRLGGG